MRTLRLVSGQRRDVSRVLQWSIESLGAGGPDSSLTFQDWFLQSSSRTGPPTRRLSLLPHWQAYFLPLCIWEALGVVTSMVRKPLVELKDCCSKFKPLPLWPVPPLPQPSCWIRMYLLPSTPTILGSWALPGHWRPGHWNSREWGHSHQTETAKAVKPHKCQYLEVNL